MSIHKFINATLEIDNEDLDLKPIILKKQIETVLTSLLKRVNEINILKSQNTALINRTTAKGDIYYLFKVREKYDDLVDQINDGIESTLMLMKFMELSDLYNSQLASIKADARSFSSTIQNKTEKLFYGNRKLLNLGLLCTASEESTDRLIFALFILDDFHLDKEHYENRLWNVAIRNSPDDMYTHLPDELLAIKWNCNQNFDDVSSIKKPLTDYCGRNSDDKNLIINLCFVAYKFFQCFNYKCSAFILDSAISILKEKKTESKVKYYHFYMCKGLLLIKCKDFEAALKVFMDGIKYMTNKFGHDEEHDILLSEEFLCIGSILVNNEFNVLGSGVLESSLKCLDRYLPQSYKLWVETTDLLSRSYNDTFDFTQALITLAPIFDYFHILNFGSIKSDCRPVYEVAIDISSKGHSQKLSRQLRYPGYLPTNISTLLNEMMISFSGLGDQTGLVIIKNWIDRCEGLSRHYRRSIIESVSFFDEIDIDRVIKKMRKNKLRHDNLFRHLIMSDIEESMMSSSQI